MKLSCPHCSQHLEGDDTLAGLTVECPRCGKPFQVPLITSPEVSAFPEPHETTPEDYSDDFLSSSAPQSNDQLSNVTERVKNVTGKAFEAMSRIASKENLDKAKTTVSDALKSGRDIAQRLSEKAPSKTAVKSGTVSLGKRFVSWFQKQSTWVKATTIVVPALVSVMVVSLLVAEKKREERRWADQERRWAANAEWRKAENAYVEAMKHYEGKGAMQDYSRALELLEEASRLGNAKANGQLAYMYWAGVGNVAEDEAKAVDYALKSGLNRTGLADLVLGSCYLYGYKGASGNVASDFEKAYESFSRSARSGYYKSQFFKGLMLYHGVGVGKDENAAAKAFYECCKSEAADSEWAGRAALCLGYMYLNGIGVGENRPTGEKWVKWGGDHAGQVHKYPGNMDLCVEASTKYLVLQFGSRLGY